MTRISPPLPLPRDDGGCCALGCQRRNRARDKTFRPAVWVVPLPDDRELHSRSIGLRNRAVIELAALYLATHQPLAIRDPREGSPGSR